MSEFNENRESPMDNNGIVPPGGNPAAPAQKPLTAWPPLRIGMVVAAALLILAVFLPYASASVFGASFSVSLIEGGDGIFFIAIAVVGIVFTLLNKQLVEMICGIAACLLSLFELISWKTQLGDLSDMVSKGFGFYLMFIASIAMLVIGILRFMQSKK